MEKKEVKNLALPVADVDRVLDHRGLHGTPSICRVRIYRNDPADVVILTELPEKSLRELFVF